MNQCESSLYIMIETKHDVVATKTCSELKNMFPFSGLSLFCWLRPYCLILVGGVTIFEIECIWIEPTCTRGR